MIKKLIDFLRRVWAWIAHRREVRGGLTLQRIASLEPHRFGSFRLQHEGKRARARRIKKFKEATARRTARLV